MEGAGEKYEGFDSEYTVEISRKMRVPERLSIGPSPIQHDKTNDSRKILHDMAVPEKIVLAGHNQHLALKPEPRPLADILTVATASASGAAGMALASDSQISNGFVALPTPPRQLTVDNYSERGLNVTDDEEGRSYSKSEAETPRSSSNFCLAKYNNIIIKCYRRNEKDR